MNIVKERPTFILLIDVRFRNSMRIWRLFDILNSLYTRLMAQNFGAKNYTARTPKFECLSHAHTQAQYQNSVELLFTITFKV